MSSSTSTHCFCRHSTHGTMCVQAPYIYIYIHTYIVGKPNSIRRVGKPHQLKYLESMYTSTYVGKPHQQVSKLWHPRRAEEVPAGDLRVWSGR